MAQYDAGTKSEVGNDLETKRFPNRFNRHYSYNKVHNIRYVSCVLLLLFIIYRDNNCSSSRFNIYIFIIIHSTVGTHTPPSYLVSALRWRSPIVFFFFTV